MDGIIFWMSKSSEMTEAQKEAFRAAKREYMRKWLAALSPERREAINAKKRAKKAPRVADLPEAKREAKRASGREHMRRWRASLGPKESAEFRAKRRARELQRQRELRASAPASVTERRREVAKMRYQRERDGIIAAQKVYRQAQKDAVLDHYGRFCACCGEDEPVFLSLDHINGDGAAHRRETRKRSGASMYSLLIREGFPAGFQVLCFNCNFAKRTGEACPHASISKARLTANVVAFRP